MALARSLAEAFVKACAKAGQSCFGLVATHPTVCGEAILLKLHEFLLSRLWFRRRRGRLLGWLLRHYRAPSSNDGYERERQRPLAFLGLRDRASSDYGARHQVPFLGSDR
jgi:hypothetical protein